MRHRRRYARHRHTSIASFKRDYRLAVLTLYEAEHHNLARLVYRVLGYSPNLTHPHLRGEIWYVLTQLADHPMPTDTQLRQAIQRVRQTRYIAIDPTTQTYRQTDRRQHDAS